MVIRGRLERTRVLCGASLRLAGPPLAELRSTWIRGPSRRCGLRRSSARKAAFQLQHDAYAVTAPPMSLLVSLTSLLSELTERSGRRRRKEGLSKLLLLTFKE